MCTCTIPTLAEARVNDAAIRGNPFRRPKNVVLDPACSTHGKAARPELWERLRGNPEVGPASWFGLAALTGVDHG